MRRELGLTAVILSIMLVRRLANGKISRRFQYMLWFFIPAYLAVSLFVHIPVAVPKGPVQNLMKSPSAVSEAVTGSGTDRAGEIRVPSDGKENASAALASASEENAEKETGDSRNLSSAGIWEILHLIYWIGFLVVLSFVFLQNLFFGISCRKKARYLGRDRETHMKICLFPGIRSPFLFGSRVYLPPEIVRNHTARRYAVLHEYCHFRQGDALWPAVRYVLLTFHWYNPLAWAACVLAGRDSELSCDEAVISLIGEEHRKDYGETLIQMAARANGMRAGLTMSTQMGKGGKSMKVRIRSIAKGTKRSTLAVILSLSLLLLTAGCSLAEPAAEASQSSVSARETTTEESSAEETVISSSNVETASSVESSEEETSYEYFPGDAGGSALFVDGTAYFDDGSGIHALELSSGTKTDLVDVPSWLSNINSGWMYYYKDTWTDEPNDDSGIYRMNLETKEEQKLLADDGTLSWNRWNIASFYGEDNYLYLDLVNTEPGGLAAYALSDEGTAELTEDSPLHSLLAAASLGSTKEDLNSLISGWIPALIHYHKTARAVGDIESGNYSVQVLDADGGEAVLLENVFGNMYPTCRGLAYQTTDYSVHLIPWGASSDQDEVIFDSAEEGFHFNYGASDAEGIYGVGSPDDGNTYFYRVGFDKTVLQLKDATKLASGGLLVNAGLCGGNDWYGYYDFVAGEQVISEIK